MIASASDPFEDPDRQRSERLQHRILARRDDGESGRGDREHQRRRARRGHGDVHAYAAPGRFAPQLLANRPRVAEQPVEAADVDDDGRHRIAAAFVARRKFLRDRDHEGVRRCSTQRSQRSRSFQFLYQIFSAISAMLCVDPVDRR